MRTAINILITRFHRDKPDTALTTIEGEIDVKTQFKQLISKDTKTSLGQDLRITEIQKSIYFIEFQNSRYSKPPIPNRSAVYFGLGIGHAGGSSAEQIWLLAESVSEVLHGKTFTRYILKDEVTGNPHPERSGIMFIDLPKLSEESSQAGELAAFLLGRGLDPRDEAVRKVAAALISSFQEFKKDKDVVEVLSLAERYEGTGWARGIAEGEARGMEKGVAKGKAEGKAEGVALTLKRMAELIKQGYSADEALKEISEEQVKPTALKKA